MGYEVQITSKTNDLGKDLILKKNNQITYVECKRFSKTKVSRPTIQKFIGAMVADNVNNGFVLLHQNFLNLVFNLLKVST